MAEILNEVPVAPAAAAVVNGGLNGVGIDEPVNVVGLNGDLQAVTPNGTVGLDASAAAVPTAEVIAEPSTSQAQAAGAPLPTYDDIFPALPGGLGGPQVMTTNSGPALGSLMSAASRLGQGAVGRAPGSQPKIRSSNVTKVYRVAPEERRQNNRRFGEQSELSRTCTDIMAKTSTDIQLTSSKDGGLNFLITGKEEATAHARRLLASEFQAQIVQQLPIPKEHHRIILGKQGKKLLEIEQATGTRIQIPKQDDASDAIRITGAREAIDKAIHEIQLISNEAFSRHIERIIVPKVYHAFIVGPFGRTVDAINKETGAKVNVPPQSVQKDEISITGERNAVLRARDQVLAIFEEKKRRTQTVSIEVKKPQHKYIVGPKGHTLNEIFEVTGVAVEMPSPDSTLETIILRGEPDKLANALAVLYQKAHSETEDELQVAGWIQRHILGPKGVKFQELSQDFPKVNVSFEIEDNRIKMSGPVADVQRASESLKKRADEIASQLSIEEITIHDPKHIKFIVGKNGANLKQIREETKATIQVIGDSGEQSAEQQQHRAQRQQHPPLPSQTANQSAQYIRIEGTRDSVAAAKKELLQLLKKLENEVSHELLIERRFYGQIIGQKGENIRDIRTKFNQVQIIFPEPNDTSEKVVIRGEKKDAEKCFTYLSNLNKELLANNYRLEVPIFRQLLQYLQGKDSIKNIREETGARVDLPNEASPDVIVITGPKDKVDKARDRIQKLQSTLGDMSSVDILIPAKIHNQMLGAKGRNIKSIMAECGGVLINFPPEGSGSDKVQIRGPKDCVTKAKKLLVDMSNDVQVNNYSEELKVPVQHHRYLIGKNGSSINALRDQTGVRVYFSSDSPHHGGAKDQDQELVTITGKKEDVQKAKSILVEKIKELDKTIESEMRVDPKYHHLFVARRAAVCKQLYDEYGGVNVSFPPQSDKTNDRIVLKGSKECVEAVKKRIAEIVADHEAQVTIECEIDAVHHRTLLGPRNKVNQIQAEYDVRIKFPARPDRKPQGGQQQQQHGESGQNSGDSTPAPLEEGAQEPAQQQKPSNIVLISGRKENCEKAKEALLALVPITITVSVPYEFHRFVIGQKGVGVRELMDRCNVNIRVPPSADKSDDIQVTGTQDCVDKAREELNKKLAEYEGEKADREARSFVVNFQVDPVYHPKIIGKRGAVITKIRQKYDVQIQVPEVKGGKEPEHPDQITVIGYEKNANEAKEAILAIVTELEGLITEEVEIDHRIHSRLIGTRGKNIKRVMDQYKVDIRFPRAGENPDVIFITGSQDNVDDAKENLLETAEGYLDDIEVQYQPPQDHQFKINFEELSASAHVKESNKGFMVRGGPWEKKKGGGGAGGANGGPQAQNNLDTNNAQDFPAFGGGPGSGAVPVNGNNGFNGNGNGTDADGEATPTVTLNGGSAWGRRN